MDKENIQKRKKLGLWISDAALFNKFLMKVAEKHGQTYGKTGDELLNAISLWLEREGEGPAYSGGEGACVAHTQDNESPASREEGEKIGMGETAPAYFYTSRKRRLKAIGELLFNNQISAIEEEKEDFAMSFRGMERTVMSQNITERRVIQDYIHTMEVKGWVEKRKGRYVIFPSTIADELDLSYPEGHIERVMKRANSEDLDEEEQQTL